MQRSKPYLTKPPAQRAAALHDTLRDIWRAERRLPKNEKLFGLARRSVRGFECLALLDNYVAYEDPAAPADGEPLAIEAWRPPSYAAAGVAAAAAAAAERVLVGKVDRLDPAPPPLAAAAAAGTPGGLVIVDYKTGKPPSNKYCRR